MYRISEMELRQYEMAHKQLELLREKHAVELQQAYDNIHPTRTGVNYELGTIYAESLNPADYAIYLVELREEHERIEKWWRMRADVYEKALRKLTEGERSLFDDYHYKDIKNAQKARQKLRKIIGSIISTKPELQHRISSDVLDALEDLEEYDRHVDQMNEEELLEDYWDIEEAN